jgi:hypothetical protein
LNAQEKADIEKALKTIDRIMTDLISGESDKAIQKATKLSYLETLQSFSADLNVHQELHYEHQAATMIADNPSHGFSDPSADQEMMGTAKTAETAATNGITEAVQTSGAVKEKLISLLNRYFAELGKRLADDNADASGKAARVDHVKSGVREHIKEMRHAD